MIDESVNYQNLAEENVFEKVDNEKILQELHSLKLQVAAKQNTINDYENELCTIQKDCETEILKMKSIHKLSETNWQERICLLENENRVLNDAYNDLLKREESLRLVVTDLQNKGRVSVRSEEWDNDVNLEAGLRQELNNCMAEKQELQDEIKRLTTANSDLQRDKNKLENVGNDLQLDVDEKNSELSAKDIQIAILKEDLLGTQALLDAERMLVGLPVKGNSLFSEVEDRRVVVEKQMLALRKENDALKFDLAATKNTLLITKNQWLSLDQLVSTEMERHLSEEQTRINYLTNQNQELINELTELRSRACLPIVFEDDGESDTPSSKKIQKFLELTLKNKTDELAQVYAKLSKQDLLNTSLVSSTRDLENQVHRAKQNIFALQASVSSCKLALNQLRQKYEPETLIEKRPASMQGEEVPKNRSRVSDVGKAPGETVDSFKDLLLRDGCEVVHNNRPRISDAFGKTPGDSFKGLLLRDGCEVVPRERSRLSDAFGKTPGDSLKGLLLRDRCEVVPKDRSRISDAFGKTPGETADSFKDLLLRGRCEVVPKDRPRMRISDGFGKTPGEPVDGFKGLLLADRLRMPDGLGKTGGEPANSSQGSMLTDSCEVAPKNRQRMSDGFGKTRGEFASSSDGVLWLRDVHKSGAIGAESIERSGAVAVLDSVRCSRPYPNSKSRSSNRKENVEFDDQPIGTPPKEAKSKPERPYVSRMPRPTSSLTADYTAKRDSTALSIEPSGETIQSIEPSRETLLEQILDQSHRSVETTEIRASLPTLDMPDLIRGYKSDRIGDGSDTAYMSASAYGAYGLPRIDALKSDNGNRDGKRKVSFKDADEDEEKEGGGGYSKMKGPAVISKYIKVDVKDADTNEHNCKQQ